MPASRAEPARVTQVLARVSLFGGIILWEQAGLAGREGGDLGVQRTHLLFRPHHSFDGAGIELRLVLDFVDALGAEPAQNSAPPVCSTKAQTSASGTRRSRRKDFSFVMSVIHSKNKKAASWAAFQICAVRFGAAILSPAS
jgi:hypothetical protein